MATTYKVLGQLLPASTSGTLYTVPSATNTIISTINIVNTGTNDSTVSIAIRKAGAAIEAKQYLVNGLFLNPKVTFTYTSGITLEATDVITVSSTNNDCAFSAFGSEIA
jgi:cystathionine beta-lyase family protein involved in aluminum resistance